MQLNRLELHEFRCYQRLSLAVPSPGLRIHGRNASGKTSLLEAVALLATTRSPRALADRELVRWDSGTDYGVRAYARVEGERVARDGTAHVSIGMELDQERIRVARKQFRINETDARAHDVVGVITCVLFTPEDVTLVGGPPAERRRQFDILASQMDRTYLMSLTQYGKVLAQRSQLLRQFARERRGAWDRTAVTELAFWDEQLIAAGSAVVAHRYAISSEIGERVASRSRSLVDSGTIGFSYVPRVELVGTSLTGDVNRRNAVVAARFEQQLQEKRSEEFRRGVTLIGPHRDDFRFSVEGRDLAAYGSRGQQRLAVVAYKIAEIDLLTSHRGEPPLLLLDDVLSELDAQHRDLLLAEIAACGCQLFVTSTDAELLDHPSLSDLPIAYVNDGGVHVEAHSSQG